MGPTNHVIVVGAGLGGLACALHLAAAGREVTVLERAGPGRAGRRISVDGLEFDTGPTVLTVPDLIAEPLDAVGEQPDDWLDLTRLDPAYRAHYPDGTTLDVLTDTDRMAEEIARVCGPAEADGYRRFVALRQRPVATGARRLHRPQPRLPARPDSANLPALLRGAFRTLSARSAEFFEDPRTQRIFSFQACTPGWPRSTRWPSTP